MELQESADQARIMAVQQHLPGQEAQEAQVLLVEIHIMFKLQVAWVEAVLALGITACHQMLMLLVLAVPVE